MTFLVLSYRLAISYDLKIMNAEGAIVFQKKESGSGIVSQANFTVGNYYLCKDEDETH